ncbi:PAS fold family [Coleofasciculus chthonoplastes PCC 7420]|uniref:histidine kinase n=1 Tax=Coleofasciculus chthonoplastes PCC 7420 TaxID=118168 RepID=B4VVM0_9CYAN|nr:ATP-binding protein [Coleofasciculus chthonoplastes]EDX73885.1 PAS fold family [Coleofasciculus chthonoplastes PCC 7420]
MLTATGNDPQKSPVILVADDDRFTRVMLRQLLEKEGYQVIEAENGEKCLAAYQQYQPDMVLLDALMPVMDGFICCQNLQTFTQTPEQKSDRALLGIPVLMITGLEDQKSIDSAFAAGAIDYVTKPLHVPVLLQRIRRLLAASWAEKALRRSEQQYRSVVENVKEVIFQIDPNGNWEFLSPAWTKLMGFTLEETLGTPFLECVHPDDCQLQKELWQSILTGANVGFQREIRYVTKTGATRWLEIHAHASQVTNGKFTGLSGILHDITERIYAAALEKEKIRLETEIIERQRSETMIRQALEKEKELGELKSHIITTISHEFRTPLTTIQSSSELLKLYDKKLTEDKKLKHFQKIGLCVEHITQLLNDVILIGQSEAGQMKFNPISLEVADLCHDLIEEFQSNLDPRYTLKVFIAESPIKGLFDEAMLRKSLNHLLSNAVKYSPKGGTITFQLGCHSDKVTVQIQDEGIGIPSIDQSRLFESFYRGSNISTIGGTGLGLAIVKKYVDLHGGQIQIESEVGIGTTVTVTLPINQ